ncbi:MAG: ubiquitin-like domain-containing protein [Anaerolineae bacterium]
MHLELSLNTLLRRATGHFPYRLFNLLATLALVVACVVVYQRSARPVTLLVNGQPFPLRTHRLTVEAVLLQTGLTLHPQDTLWPPPQSGLNPGQAVEITLARPVVVALDGFGAHQTLFTRHQTPAQIFKQLGIAVFEEDDIYLDDALWNPTEPIPATFPPPAPRTAPLSAKIEALRPLPVRLTLRRAIPVHLDDVGQTATIFTTAQTVGDVLLAQNIPLYLGDAISPDLSAPLAPDTTITIERAIPLSIRVDGRLIKTRTRLPTVGRALAPEGVALVGQDYTIPPEETPITGETTVRVVRVSEALEIKKETTDFETVWRPDHNLELDRQEISQPGQEGVTKTRTRARYENGQEVRRVEEETWLEQEPADKIITYGTKVAVRTLETPDGPIEYWRKIRMLATSYSAATSGKDKDHPAYGVTRTGLQAGYGVVAVDPGVVALRSQVYVPGYGQAIAGDTGGAILGKHIDLGFDEDSPPLWYKWVDVYLLTPAPPWHEIRYVLPQWPQER